LKYVVEWSNESGYCRKQACSRSRSPMVLALARQLYTSTWVLSHHHLTQRSRRLMRRLNLNPHRWHHQNGMRHQARGIQTRLPVATQATTGRTVSSKTLRVPVGDCWGCWRRRRGQEPRPRAASLRATTTRHCRRGQGGSPTGVAAPCPSLRRVWDSGGTCAASSCRKVKNEECQDSRGKESSGWSERKK
jgi:hypothetical protein